MFVFYELMGMIFEGKKEGMKTRLFAFNR
jgi:hypothetical protein